MSLWTQADTPIEKARLILQPMTHSPCRDPPRCSSFSGEVFTTRKDYDCCKRRQWHYTALWL